MHVIVTISNFAKRRRRYLRKLVKMVLHRAKKNRLVKVEKCAAVFSSPPTVFYGLCNPHDEAQTRGGLNALKNDIGVSKKRVVN